ncbi:carboxylesterase [Macrolepiota fuliginosa MF-IS2]|uniref:Carboxylic ester hydrolase n=1 Tax=Macrolepiota fuliginosa MF-IS2 TaxID=1400762 RepID=A0A9P5XN32_9AGAR|nr:carboxylesterase [Macrolepiota fuliginosa MF-IS2]
MGIPHLHEELQDSTERVVVSTKYGDVVGGRACTGAAVFLEVPYALPPGRFQDPQPLPEGYKYEKKEYITESAYATQPTNDGQAQGSPFGDKVGRGQPTENPLFLNIVVPPSFPAERNFLVKVYIHGGFLQFGSPHSLSSQAQFIAAQRKEIWLNIGYRVSAFGFLASDIPRLDGNYGFKDQWLGLKWIRDNIASFGGDPGNVHLTGLSAGAHSVHQILHRVSLLPDGEMAPFQTAALQSNAILTDPKTPAQLRPQFQALCRSLGLNPDEPTILDTLRNSKKVSWQSITRVIENDMLGQYGTFRGCLASDWMIVAPGPMARQRSGAFTSSLKAHGVKALVIGNLTEEWYLYSIAHPVSSPRDILPNLNRYFPDDISGKLLKRLWTLGDDPSEEETVKSFGEVLSAGQVYLPVVVFIRDMMTSGFPVVRYQIQWTPEGVRPHEGYVTHGTDRCLWALRKPNLDAKEWDTANRWVEVVDKELKKVIQSGNTHQYREVLTLKEDQSVGWTNDERWNEFMDLVDILPGERGKGSRL